MKKGLSDANFIPYWSIERFLKSARQAGFEGVELNLREIEGALTFHTPITEVRKIVEATTNHEIEIASLSTALLNYYPLSSGHANIRQKGMQIGKKLIDFAAEMGVKIVQMVPGTASNETSYHISYELAVESLQQLGERAEASGVIIGIENVCNKFLPGPMEFSRFLDDVNNPCVKAYFDNGNALATGYPEHFIRILKDRIVAAHMKDYWQAAGVFTSIMEGDTSWPVVMQALEDNSFNGYLIATPHYPYDYGHDRHIEKYSQDLTTILHLINQDRQVNNM